MPSMRQARVSFAMSAVMGQLFVCGGAAETVVSSKYALDSAERFDVNAASWNTIPPMSTRRFGHHAAAAMGNVYVCGGASDPTHVLSSMERFVPSRNEWEAMPPMTCPRIGHSAVVLAGKLLIFGGRDVGDFRRAWEREVSTTSETYDVAQAMWTSGVGLPSPRANASAGVVFRAWHAMNMS
mmetsp:Transcript_47430/g.103774  ORF Transcript_47430/g.103774 Transcript_47430/m.103774 type:complete len:182 (+) Transcript_47430:99-644(+)